ncbi:M20 aminoacylase family protein [Seohaeicola zhoushanensis]|uniref:Amidohydrolase n=1 Tax=Seohaeicola zhoushanensis TaxID=1569283 RepID=A0A8J3M9L3_9RHOB|nr:M20 aminoacylase family protein [Seohaeicola zhoushanensis]GHF60099.1 amidohydrolase [Seohaeicola zhoushanensis]
MPVKNSIADRLPALTAIRRDIHAHPELRFAEHRTAALVAERLREWGCDEVVEGIAGTGVVGVIRGRTTTSNRAIGFRADMDALPLIERSGVDHVSTIPGRMHACGHDGHTTMLLGAAQYLAETRNFDGTVVLLFQPAEEGGGGAKAMIADGVMERWGIQEVYGMHNWPGLPVGSFAVKDGPLLAAADGFEITVRGVGGHGARPALAVDTTLAACAVVMALQSVVARNVDPLKTAVLSICGLESESTAYNVIPDRIVLRGTTRFFDPALQSLLVERIETLAASTAAAYGASAEVTYTRSVGPVLNAPENTAHAIRAAELVAGEVNTTIRPDMAAEDFADMLAVRPGCYMLIGNGPSADLHNPAYEFNDEAIPAGSSWFATLAEQRLPFA